MADTYAPGELDAARDEAGRLTSRILELREAYYERDAAIASDQEYDALMRRLEEIEHLFPELQGQDSPTGVNGRVDASSSPGTTGKPCSRRALSSTLPSGVPSGCQ